jgi:secreted trypsin-like serine protease
MEDHGRTRRGLRTTGLMGVALALMLGLLPSPANAIVYGQPDGNLHPNVGAMVYQRPSDGELRRICTGTLISSDVFLTAGHCTDALEGLGIPPDEVWVSFDPVFDPQTSTLHPGTYHTHPEFGFSGPGGTSDPHDIAVIVLDDPAAITPAEIPTEGLLSQMKAGGELQDQTFTAVGYGTVRDTRKGGPQGIKSNTERRFALQSFLSLTPAWLTLSMNEATGDGGTCFGDSGGPHFLGGETSNLIVSITVTGDAVCKATDKTYRIDTASARDFLDDFVAVP